MWIPKPLILPFNRRMTYTFHKLADWQLGGNVCDEEMIRTEVHEIVDNPQAVWCFLGDIEDEDRPTTRVRRRANNADRPEVNLRDAQKHLAWIDQKVIPIMAPLTQRPCLGVLAGHHWTQLTPARNSVQYICMRLSQIAKKKNGYKVPYLGVMQSWAPIRFEGTGSLKGERIRRMFHLEHGVGGSQAVGSALKKLEKRAKGIYADVYARAHDLKLEVTKIDSVEASGESETPRIYHRTKLLLNTGGASRAHELTRGNPTYPEQGGMSPATMGWARVNAYLRKYYPWEKQRDGRKWTCLLRGEI